MKQITKEEMQKLIDNHYIKNTGRGFVDRRGYTVGFYRTKKKRYIEDKYVDIANRLT